MSQIYVNESCIIQPIGSLKNNASYNSTGKYVTLTAAVNIQNGELEYNLSLPMSIEIDFDFWTGGGSGADAVYFYLGANSTITDEDHGNGGYIFAYDEYSGDNAPFQITFDTTRLAGTTGAATFADSTWHKAKITIQNTQLKMFLDGVEVLAYKDISRTLGNLLGWGARTGGINNEHRIRNLKIVSIDPIVGLTSTVLKRYYYKVYDTNLKYITTWSQDVISEPIFRTVINGGAGDLNVSLARKYDNFGEGVDVALGNRVEVWIADSDNLANNLANNTLWDTAMWDVDVWDNPIRSFVKLYTGVISQYAPVLDSSEEYVDVTVLGLITESSYKLLKDSSGNTTFTYTGKDPSFIIQDLIDKYRADGGININYSANSIQTTGTKVTYTFQHMILKDALDKVIELSPDNWFYFLDPNGTIYYQQSNLTQPNHTLTIGKEIMYSKTIKRTENVVNEVSIIGGGATNLLNIYQRTGSQGTYGKHHRVVQDNNVTDNATADLMAKRLLDMFQLPETRTILRIMDNNGEDPNLGANIESYQVGDSVQIKNLSFGSKGNSNWDMATWDIDVWDYTLQSTTASILTIVSLNYNPDYIEVEASSRLPEVTKDIQTLNRIITALVNKNLPLAPTTRSI